MSYSDNLAGERVLGESNLVIGDDIQATVQSHIRCDCRVMLPTVKRSELGVNDPAQVLSRVLAN